MDSLENKPVVLYEGLFKDKENEEITLYTEDTFSSSRAPQSQVNKRLSYESIYSVYWRNNLHFL